MKFLPPEDEPYSQSEASAEFGHLLMPFCGTGQVAGDFGTILSQHFMGEDFQVWQHHFYINRPIFIYVLSSKPILTINYMLQGNPVAKIPGLDKIPLYQKSAQLFYLPCIKQAVWFDPGEYHCTRIVFSHLYLQKFITRSASIEMLFDYALNTSEKLLPHAVGNIDEKEMDLLDELIKGKGDLGATYVHRKATVLNLLLQYMDKHHLVGPKALLPGATIDRMEEVKQYIDQHLCEKLEIPKLASQFGLSVSTLRRSFASKYNKSPYQYFQEKRLLYGVSLMRGGLTVSEVSDKLGYPDCASFTHAFTNCFDCSPMQYLKGAK